MLYQRPIIGNYVNFCILQVIGIMWGAIQYMIHCMEYIVSDIFYKVFYVLYHCLGTSRLGVGGIEHGTIPPRKLLRTLT